MPELPEVETTRRGLQGALLGRRLLGVEVREPRLRWPVPPALGERLPGRRLHSVERRAKYLLLGLDAGVLIVHLGMSGSLRLTSPGAAFTKHDHVQWLFEGGRALRLRDPRRFGAVLWTDGAPARHPLLAGLGPEPLSAGFDGRHLHQRSRGRRSAVKSFIMDSGIVAGVGNIYATEALFMAGIHPRRPAGRISARRYQALAGAIQSVLEAAIATGGTTLRDFHGAGGEPGSYRQRLRAYGREGRQCPRCGQSLRKVVISQRATVYCARCQR